MRPRIVSQPCKHVDVDMGETVHCTVRDPEADLLNFLKFA